MTRGIDRRGGVIRQGPIPAGIGCSGIGAVPDDIGVIDGEEHIGRGKFKGTVIAETRDAAVVIHFVFIRYGVILFLYVEPVDVAQYMTYRHDIDITAEQAPLGIPSPQRIFQKNCGSLPARPG